MNCITETDNVITGNALLLFKKYYTSIKSDQGNRSIVSNIGIIPELFFLHELINIYTGINT